MPCYEYRGKKYRALDLIKEIKSDEQAFIKSNNLQTGKWRYEVPDGKVLNKNEWAREKLKEFDWKYSTFNQMFEAHPEIKKEYDEFPDILDGKTHKLKDVYLASELYSAYPELENVNIVYKQTVDKGASYNPRTKTIELNDVIDVNSTIAHEIQHYIQDVSGFASGGNLISAKSTLSAEEQVELSNLIETLPELEALMNDAEFGTQTRRDAEKAYVDAKNRIEELSPKTRYNRLAGEVESRNVQTRMNFTPEQRRETLLSETEDVSREDQIFIFEGLGETRMETSENKPLSEKEFYKKYKAQHKDIRSEQNGLNPEETFKQIQENGFTGTPNALPLYRGGKPANVVQSKYGPKKGDYIYLIPKEYVYDSPNGLRIKEGWKPTETDFVKIEYDYQSAYEAYLNNLNKEQPIPETITINGKERPTRNSNGQYIHPTEEGIKNFWNWFGESKVVDEAGRPMVVYHGTNKNFDEFSYSKFGDNTGAPLSALGFYFTEDSELAGNFTKGKNWSKGGKYKGNSNVIPVFLALNNPKIMPAYQWIQMSGRSILSIKETRDNLINQGFDGIIIGTWKDSFDSNDTTKELKTPQFVAFNPNQIKSSTGNAGTFDKENPNINFSFGKKEGSEDVSEANNETTNDIRNVLLNTDNRNNSVDRGIKSEQTTKGTTDKNGERGTSTDKGNEEVNEPGVSFRLANLQETILFSNGTLTDNLKIAEEAGELFGKMEKPKLTRKQVIDELKQVFIDRALPILNWQKEILKRGGKLAENVNAYRDYRNSFGRVEALYRKFDEEYMQPVKDAIVAMVKESKVTANEILAYMIAKHGLENNKYMRTAEVMDWAIEQEFSGAENLIKERKDGFTPKNMDEFLDYANGNFAPAEIQAIEGYAKKLSKKDYSGILPFDKTGKKTDPDALAESIINGFEQKVTSEGLKTLWDTTRNATGNTLQTWLDGGQISKKQYDFYRNQFANFVPLRGWREGAAKVLNYKNNEGTGGGSLKSREGRKSMADNPLSYIQSVAFKAIGEQVANEIKQEAAKIVFQNYGKNFNDLHQLKEVWLKKSKFTDPETGKTEDVWDIYRDANGEIGTPTPEEKKSGNVKKETNFEHERLRTIWNARQHEVIVFNKGKASIIVFPEKSLYIAQALNGQNTMFDMFGRWDKAVDLQKFGDSAILRTMGKITNFMKGMMTSYNPVFPLTNFFRDQPEAALTQFIRQNTRIANFPMEYTPTAAKTIIAHVAGKLDNNSDLAKNLKNFYELGGTTGFTHEKSAEQLEKEFNKELKRALRTGTVKGVTIDKVANLLKYIETWNRIFEDTTRFAVYLSALDKGLSPKDAAFESRNASVDFNMKGKGINIIESLYAFFKAGVNATQKNFQLAKLHPKKFAAVAATVATLGFLEAMINDWGDDDDDDYLRINDFVRHNYLVFHQFWGKKDKYVRIPLPQFWRGFHALGVASYDVVKGKSNVGKATAQTAANFVAGMSPVDFTGFFSDGEFNISPLVPTPAKPFKEIADNKDFMGNKIFYEAFTKALEGDLADSGLHKKNVNAAAKFFTDMLFKAGGGEGKLKFKIDENGKLKYVPNLMDVNPSKIEHIVTGYTGGVGRVSSDIITSIVQMASQEQPMDLDNIPFANSFIRNVPEEKWQVLDNYNTLKNALQDADTFKRYAKADNDYERQGRYYKSDYAKLKPMLDAYEKMIDMIMETKGFDSEEASTDVTKLMKDFLKKAENN